MGVRLISTALCSLTQSLPARDTHKLSIVIPMSTTLRLVTTIPQDIDPSHVGRQSATHVILVRMILINLLQALIKIVEGLFSICLAAQHIYFYFVA